MVNYPVLDEVLTYGFAFATTAWLMLSALCLLGLVFMLVGHRVATPGRVLINQIIFYFMVAVLAFSAIFVILALYAYSIEHDYAFALIIFIGAMLMPIILSIIGLLLRRFSRFPVHRQP
jgi:hypothetical protein